MKAECVGTGLTRLATLVLLSFSAAWAQQPNKPNPANQPEKKALPGKGRERLRQVAAQPSSQPSKDDYVMDPEDVLAVYVWREPENSRTAPVRSDGKISLPLIGDLQASGLTPLKLRNLIAEKLKAYMSNPEVTVIVQEVKSQRFNIVGAVLRPGSYDLAKPLTVLDARAGGWISRVREGR